MTTRPTIARVDLEALAHNYRTLAAFLARTDRRDGSAGHHRRGQGQRLRPWRRAGGLALEAAGAPMLACADIDEGVLLRAAGVTAPILVFGALSIGELDGIVDHSPDADGVDAGRGPIARTDGRRVAACGCRVI